MAVGQQCKLIMTECMFTCMHPCPGLHVALSPTYWHAIEAQTCCHWVSSLHAGDMGCVGTQSFHGTVTTLPEVTQANGCELSFFLRGKQDLKMDQKQYALYYHIIPEPLAPWGLPAAGQGGCAFPAVSLSPKSLGSTPKAWCSTQIGVLCGLISAQFLLLFPTPMVPQVLWNSFLDSHFPWGFYTTSKARHSKLRA